MIDPVNKAITFYNPYIAGPPITDPKLFFGRQADLEKVIDLLKNNFVMLVGSRRIGKTSMLHQLLYHLPRLTDTVEQFLPVLVSAEGTAEAEFFHAVMEEMVEATQKHLPGISADLSFDLSDPTYSTRAFSRDLQVILKNLQDILPTPARLALLLDEMDTLNGYNLATQAQLRRIFQRFTHQNLSVVVAGVKLHQHWAGESSPFYNMFVPVTLTPFPEAEARRLITEPVEDIFGYDDEAVVHILEATLGLPHRIQQLCMEIIYRLLISDNERTRITTADVDITLREIDWLDEEVSVRNEFKEIAEFINVISHELRTPMASIIGYVRVLETGMVGPVTDEQKAFLKVISNDVDRMAQLINDLLDFSRVEAGRIRLEIQDVHIGAIINKVLESFHKKLQGTRLQVSFEVEDNLPELRADTHRLTQIMTSLISNAYKYTPEGGHIIVSAKRPNEDSNNIKITVEDTGYGISKEDQSKLFTKFFRANDPNIRSLPGSGLGLVIAKQMVEAHGGRLTFESEPGQGSTFTIMMPVASQIPPGIEVVER